MEIISQKSITEIIGTTPWPRKLYNSAKELWQDSKELHHWYIVWRTLDGKEQPYKDFKPDSVFYVGRSPAAYLKNVDKIDEEDIRKWQRFLWNQAVVPMLIVKSRTQIRVYTACTQPSKKDSNENIEWLLQTTADVLELERLWTTIEAGGIYETNSKLFDRTQAVDYRLLENINDAATLLSETQIGEKNEENLEFVHQFLTRLLFVCYLTERGMIKGEHFSYEPLRKIKPATKQNDGYFLHHLFDDLKTYTEKKEALCRIFAQVKDRFNGSLFPETIAQEKDRYNENFIEIIGVFLRGDELKTGQLSLFSWAYDFRIIPIEIISSVYESFLCSQGKTKEEQGETNSQKTTGSYYTPLHLAELVVDIALEGIKDGKPIHDLKILDPACGSGVFLVSLFGRMAESLRVAEGHTENKRCIDWARKVSLLLKQLYGVDIKTTACHITCFSLYLALLEQLEPMDVEYLRSHNENKKALQPLLAENSKGHCTIYNENLFNPQLSLKERAFDIVIGNPPWVSRQHQKDVYFLRWQKNNPALPTPEKQIAHGFMWEAPKYLSDTGIACFLLPATVLLNNHTNQFQKEWFKSVTVERVINFSDLRFILFDSAIHPCVAISFRCVKPNIENIIRYESPKTDIRSQKGGTVYIREEDTVYLDLKEIRLAATNNYAHTVWKTHYWGSWRDKRLLLRLMGFYKLSDLAGEIKEHKRWNTGQGIQVGGGDPNPVWWKSSTLYLDSKIDVDLVVCKDDLVTIKQAGVPVDIVHRPRDKKLFLGPKVLLAKGSRRVLFCHEDAVFRDTFLSITGVSEDTPFLRF
ncbi:MAG: HsdM family class I SAM-dependent methyltransferase, partial [Sedimentisphaerales bacterium]